MPTSTAGRALSQRLDARASKANITIAVTDQGIGIPCDALEKVFEKFYRVARNDGRAPGTGLGLSICAGFIKTMGGTIVAESPITGTVGTRITIMLPTAEHGVSQRTPPKGRT